jgi:hypothetical protein
MMLAQLAAQDAAHQQSLVVVAGHYQRQIANLAGFVKSKFPDEQELPPSLFAAPPLCDNPPRKIPYYRLRPIHFGH